MNKNRDCRLEDASFLLKGELVDFVPFLYSVFLRISEEDPQFKPL